MLFLSCVVAVIYCAVDGIISASVLKLRLSRQI